MHLISLLSSIIVITYAATDGPIVLNSVADYKNLIKQHKMSFIKFYAPWCGHCKNMAEDYQKLAKEFSNDGRIAIAEMDANKIKEIRSVLPIHGYPTLLFFNGESHEKYSKHRDFDSMKTFVNEKLAESSHRVYYQKSAQTGNTVHNIDQSDLDELMSNPQHNVLVLYMAPWCQHSKNLAPIYAQLPEMISNVKVSQINCDEYPEACQTAQIEGYPTIRLHLANGVNIEYDGPSDAKDIQKFVSDSIAQDRDL